MESCATSMVQAADLIDFLDIQDSYLIFSVISAFGYFQKYNSQEIPKVRVFLTFNSSID